MTIHALALARPLTGLLWLTLFSGVLCSSDIELPAVDGERDEEYRRGVVGVWEDDYQGKRTMTIRPDGTALMVVELSGAKALLYASRLEFEMKWSVEGGRLRKQTTAGKPPGRVKLILKTMGDQVDEPILELTEERLVLLDGDGKRKYTWRRMPNPEETKSQPETAEPAPEE